MVPLSEQLFNLNYNLCKEFPAIHPFEVEQKTFHEIVRLYSRVRVIQIRENKELAKLQRVDGTQTDKVIRRPAGDDWF